METLVTAISEVSGSASAIKSAVLVILGVFATVGIAYGVVSLVRR